MKRTAFVEDWLFKKEGGEPQKVRLPHDAMQEQGRAADAPSGSGGAFYLGGMYEYEKVFYVPEEWRGQEVILEFEGICPMADIYLNGIKLGSCSYGYTGYRFALKELIYGRKNVLKAVVDGSSLPNSRWYLGAGIYRPVWLWIGNKVHVEPDGIRVTTMSTSPAVAAVEVNHTGQKDSGIESRISLFFKGKLVCEQLAAENEAKTEITIHDAHLWDAEHPNLYDCTVTLMKNGEILDTQSTKFGIRTLKWSADGFFVNGREVLLKGGCIHHDNGILGARTYAQSEWRRIRKLKEYGFNAVRSAHNPACASLLEACDALGMYVMDEGWDMWYKPKNEHDYARRFEEHYEEDIEAIISKDYNHPSVILYSIGNEVTEPCEEKGVELGKKLVKLFHEKDSSRPVTAGINLTLLYAASMGMDLAAASFDQEGENSRAGSVGQGSREMNSTLYNEMVSGMGAKMNQAAATEEADQTASPILDVLDIAGYNYASSRYEIEGEKNPGRIVVGSETYASDLPVNWEQVEKYPYLIGDFMWTAWDYLGETGIGAWTWEEDGASFQKKYPWLLADTGAFDILGNDNAEAGQASVIWKCRTTPYIGVVPVNHPGQPPAKAIWRGTNALPCWSYRGCEGNPAQVEVYSQGSSAELFLNGRSLGRKPLERGKAVFDTFYEPGALKAAAYNADGTLLSESSLCSAQGSVKILIRPEEQAFPHDSIRYIDISLAGENGEIECNMDTRLEVSVEGGELLAFGSANPRTQEDFLSGKYTTYYGRSLAVIKCGGDTVTIKVKGEGLETASLQIPGNDPLTEHQIFL